jgi:RNA polymerase sigma-70 factor (ECF subfamily)
MALRAAESSIIRPAQNRDHGSLAGKTVHVLSPRNSAEAADVYEPGSEADFVRLYEREALRLTRTVYGILGNTQDAEDCVQEAFARAFRDWAKWKQTAPARFWVQRIAVNLALSRRRHQKLAEVKDRLLGRTPRDEAEAAATTIDLLGCLRQLPVKQLTVVLMRFNHGYNNREIAQALGLSDRAVGLRMESGLRRLSQLMDGGGHNAEWPLTT